MNAFNAYEYFCDRSYALRQQQGDEHQYMVEALLESEYSINKPENVNEAIANLDESDILEITRLIGEGEFGDQLAIGKLITDHIECYWIKRAEQDAAQKLAERRAEMADARRDYLREESF